MRMIINILKDTIIFTTPVLLCTIGGLLSYNIGIVNIGLEGFMLFGGLSGAITVYLTSSYYLGIAVCIITSIFIGLIYAFFSIYLKSNFIITGFSINILALAISSYILALLRETSLDLTVVGDISLKFDKILKNSNLNKFLSAYTPLVIYSIIILILITFLLNKTIFGKYIKVIGENEDAARAVGINIKKVKYITLILSSIIIALGGYNIAIEQVRLFSPDIISGAGFVAIAAFYCGKGKPLASAGYCALYGMAKALSINLAFGNPAIEGMLKVIPYLTIIIFLTITSIMKNKNNLLRGVYDE